MKKVLLLIFISALFCSFSKAQTYTIKGNIKDATSSETLIGANITYATGKGVVSDIDGNYSISLVNGEYTLTFSYIGYKPIEKKITVAGKNIICDVKLETTMLNEVQVVADIAKTRETPVAFTNITPRIIEENLASQDMPMLLNSTPGVYATQQGGGDGDARINIRGFNQRNVAVMLDGIPVNDMENGWVYWSNWFGLDIVTRNIQVQRGLGASKIAIPSIGGTMNIMTSGIETKKSLKIKEEITSEGQSRTTLGYTSGELKHGFSFTSALSYKFGDGWVDNTQSEGYFYYLKVDKKIKKHIISISAMGAPQNHAQRAFQKPVALYSHEYAKKIGIPDSVINLNKERGLRYNQHWGVLNRDGASEVVSEQYNYYHKPQFSLRDFWNVNKKLYVSNILYASIGNGGGVSYAAGTKNGVAGSSTSYPLDTVNGLIDFQSIYNTNKTGPYQINTLVDPNERWAGGILNSKHNEHRWYGLLTTLNYTINDELELSGGLDFRNYKGIHYKTIYDLLGGDYFMDNTNKTTAGNYTSETQTLVKHIGDTIGYNYQGLVKWGGAFTQLEYKNGNITTFINLSAAYTGYKRIDFYKNKDLVIDGKTYNQAVGFGDIFLTNGTDNITFNSGNDGKDKMFTSGDTTFIVKINGSNKDTVSIVNAKQYTQNSAEARYSETNWVWRPGFTIKGGLNYNIDEFQNAFLNLGYISKAPRFSNVFDNNNTKIENIENENIKALELGYSYSKQKISLNLNTYYTLWSNRPADFPSTVTINDEQYKINVNGMNARHTGIEGDFIYKVTKKIELEGLASYGDWIWTSKDTFNVEDPNTGIPTGDKISFDAKGVHVGDAAQTQLGCGIRYEIIKGLYIKPRLTYFGRYYSQFDPFSLSGENAGRESWMMPNYTLVDLNMGYRFYVMKKKVDFRFNILNLFNKMYISDAANNDSYTQSFNDFDAKSAAVFFGMGRRFTTSLQITL
ncbi:MAG: TonB-dependent receptor [Bacteroidota bacterium]